MSEFREFLARKARKAEVRRVGKYLSWREDEVALSRAPTEFLDMFYLSQKPGDVVMMDRSTARDLEERLKRLEEEVKRLRGVNNILKAVIVGLLVLLIVVVLRLIELGGVQF